MTKDEQIGVVVQQETAALMAEEHLKTGMLYAELSKRIETKYKDKKSRPYFIHSALVKSAVISSACALEAYINEWFTAFEDLVDGAPEKAFLINKLWELGIPKTAKYSILEKYQIALTLMEQTIFDKGAEPYQSVDKVVKLRNALVHYEPSFEPHTGSNDEGSEGNRLGRILSNSFKLNTLCVDTAPIWPFKILGAGCSEWSSKAALTFMEEFHKRDSLDVSIPIERDRLIEETNTLANSDWAHIFSSKVVQT